VRKDSGIFPILLCRILSTVRPLAKAFGLENKSYLSDFTQPWTGIIKGQRIETELKKIIGARNEI